MAQWYFETPVVAEGPLAWEVPLDRYKMDRGISIGEILPGVFEAQRFWSYTDQNDIINAGRQFYQGGHVYVVDDTVRAQLIAAPDIGVTAANFTPYP